MDRIDKALKVLDSDISGYRISKSTPLSESAVSRYRSGKFSAQNMTIKNAIALAEFYEEYFENENKEN